jgi:ketosteroid isomerase-like protein
MSERRSSSRPPRRRRPLLLLFGVLLGACADGGGGDSAPAEGSAPDTAANAAATGDGGTGGDDATAGGAADARALMAADSAFSAAASSRGVEGFLEFVADSATFFDGSSMHRGREAVGESWRPLLETPGNSMTWKPTSADVAASGDLGYTIGRWEFTGAEGSARGSYVTIWRRQPDGAWKVVVDIGDTDAPPGPEQAQTTGS